MKLAGCNVSGVALNAKAQRTLEAARRLIGKRVEERRRSFVDQIVEGIRVFALAGRGVHGTEVEARAREMMDGAKRSRLAEASATGAQAGGESDGPRVVTVDDMLSAMNRQREPASATTAKPAAAGESTRAREDDPRDPMALVAEARELYLKGKDLYRKASSSGDRPSLKKAFDMLTEACDLAERAHTKRPTDRTIVRLIEDIAVLRYACFKQQVL